MEIIVIVWKQYEEIDAAIYLNDAHFFRDKFVRIFFFSSYMG